jgi:hypothetical protein
MLEKPNLESSLTILSIIRDIFHYEPFPAGEEGWKEGIDFNFH